MVVRYETIKSVVLFFLVGFSIYLTWTLWSYQPKLDPVDSNIHEMLIGSRKEVSDLIKPTYITYHIDDKTYGTHNTVEILSVIKDMSKWNFYEIGNTQIVGYDKIHDLLHKDNRVVIHYPDLVPFDLYKGILQLKEDYPQAAFDKIVIQSLDGENDTSPVYFVDTVERKAYQSHVNPERINNFFSKMNVKRNQYRTYSRFNIPDGRVIYLPEGNIEMVRYKYLYETINTDRLKEALFRDPSKVRRDFMINGEQYLDDTSLMRIYLLHHTLSYVNPSQDNKETGGYTYHDLLKLSIDFVNEHGGWTDNYQYFQTSLYENTVVFRLYRDGYPVFNEQGMAEIRQIWGPQEIYKYDRPYFSLEIPLPDRENVLLPSSEEVYNHLLVEYDNPKLIQDIVLGYRLSKDFSNENLMILEPTWYYLYAGYWFPLDSQELWGKFDGLE